MNECESGMDQEWTWTGSGSGPELDKNKNECGTKADDQR